MSEPALPRADTAVEAPGRARGGHAPQAGSADASPAQVTKIARLRNGEEVPVALAAMVTLSLQSLLAETQPRRDATEEDAVIALKKERALFDANQLARDPGYEMWEQSRQILTSFRLLESDGKMRSDVRAVVLSAVRGKGADLHVGSPVLRKLEDRQRRPRALGAAGHIRPARRTGPPARPRRRARPATCGEGVDLPGTVRPQPGQRAGAEPAPHGPARGPGQGHRGDGRDLVSGQAGALLVAKPPGRPWCS
jgi:hypothetical protein